MTEDSAMIMRVAKAINGPHHPAPDLDKLRDIRWNMLDKHEQIFTLNIARAVFREMREPTIAMMLSCADLNDSQQAYWHRSIDMALSDKDM